MGRNWDNPYFVSFVWLHLTMGMGGILNCDIQNWFSGWWGGQGFLGSLGFTAMTLAGTAAASRIGQALDILKTELRDFGHAQQIHITHLHMHTTLSSFFLWDLSQGPFTSDTLQMSGLPARPTDVSPSTNRGFILRPGDAP